MEIEAESTKCSYAKDLGIEKQWICTICLSTTNITPLPDSKLHWLKMAVKSFKSILLSSVDESLPDVNRSLSDVNGSLPDVNRSLPNEDRALVFGACVKCSWILRRTLLLVRRAQKAQSVLYKLKSIGELSFKNINQANEIEGPIISLSCTHLGPDHFNYDYIYEEKNTVYLKQEIDVDVKNEVGDQFDDNDVIMFDSENSEDEKLVNVKRNKTMLEKNKRLTKTSVEKPKRLTKTKMKKKQRLSKTTLEKKQWLSKTKMEKKQQLTKTTLDKKKRFATKSIKTLSEAKRLQMETDLKLQKYFVVEKLSFEEQKTELLKLKESKNYKNSYLKCDLCYKGFADVAAYERHKMRHTEAVGRYKCEICQVHCRELARHMNENHKFKYTCKECNVVTRNRTSAATHATFHEGKKFVCDICGQVFSHKSTHLSHVRIKHPSEEHVCLRCGFSFLNEKGLKFHASRQHRLEEDEINPDGPQCVECGVRFQSARALATHERVSPKHGDGVRNDSSRFPHPGSGWGCGRGHRRFPSRTERKKRDKEEVVICEQCGEPQSSQAQYRIHLSSQHGVPPPTPRPRLCTLCGRTFKSVQMLHNHAKCHNPKFECTVCKKKFTVAASLTTHMNIHTKEKVYSCAICGRTFNHVANQRRHVATVHSEIRIQCEFCEKYFKSRLEIDAHIKHVHLKVPYPKRNRQRSSKNVKIVADDST